MLFIVSNNLRFKGLSESEFRVLMDLKNYRRRSTGRIFEVPVDRPVDRSTGRWSIDRGTTLIAEAHKFINDLAII